MSRSDEYGLLLFAQRPTIGPIVLNCTTRELHGRTYTSTDLPVEDGAVLADHRIRDPIMLEIEGVLSPMADTLPAQFSPAEDPSAPSEFPALDQFASAWARLVAYADDPRPSQVITALEVYENMLPESFSHEEIGFDAIQFRMVLKEREVARTRREQFLAPDVEARGKGEDDLGQQGSRELSAQEQSNVEANFSSSVVEVAA